MELKDIISSGILEQYSLGLTSENENIQVREWIDQFPEVKVELGKIQLALEEYAFAHSIEPGQSFKEKILNRINVIPSQNIPDANAFPVEERENATVVNMPAYFKWAAAASVALLIGSLIFNYTYYNKYRSASTNLQVVQSELSRQKEIASAMNRDINVVTDKYARPVVLNGTPHAPDALAKIFWMKNTGEVYVDPTNLPQAAAGKQYQLWAIVNGKPVDAGMISTRQGIYKIQKMKSFGKAEAFAITLEKEGGSPSPTMEEMYVIAKI